MSSADVDRLVRGRGRRRRATARVRCRRLHAEVVEARRGLADKIAAVEKRERKVDLMWWGYKCATLYSEKWLDAGFFGRLRLAARHIYSGVHMFDHLGD